MATIVTAADMIARYKEHFGANIEERDKAIAWALHQHWLKLCPEIPTRVVRYVPAKGRPSVSAHVPRQVYDGVWDDAEAHKTTPSEITAWRVEQALGMRTMQSTPNRLKPSRRKRAVGAADRTLLITYEAKAFDALKAYASLHGLAGGAPAAAKHITISCYCPEYYAE